MRKPAECMAPGSGGEAAVNAHHMAVNSHHMAVNSHHMAINSLHMEGRTRAGQGRTRVRNSAIGTITVRRNSVRQMMTTLYDDVSLQARAT